MAVIIPVIVRRRHMAKRKRLAAWKRPHVIGFVIFGEWKYFPKPFFCLSDNVRKLRIRLTEKNSAPVRAMPLAHVLQKIHKKRERLAWPTCAFVEHFTRRAEQKLRLAAWLGG